MERLREALEMWQRFGPRRGDNPGTPVSDLTALVAAARAVLDGQPVWWCEVHDMPEAAQEESDICWLYDGFEDCLMVERVLVGAV